jgi:hypothetical protein
MRATRGKVEEPLWRASLGVLCRTVQGDAICHEWSEGDPRYSESETQGKIDRLRANATGATLCATLSAHRPEACKACPHQGKIKSPISLGMDTSPAAAAVTQPQQAQSGKGGQGEASAEASLWRPGMLRKIGGALRRITSIDLMNKQYVMLDQGGQPPVVTRVADAQFLKPSDFKTLTASEVIVTGVSQGRVSTCDAATVWLKDTRRRIANRLTFTSRKAAPGDLNLWTRFGVEPMLGQCPRIYQHIHEVICAGHDIENEAFLNLIAWQVRNVGRASRIIVVLKSIKQQVGKGVLLEQILLPMWGLHGAFISDASKAFGRFNDLLVRKAFVAIDEDNFAGDKERADRVKSASAAEIAAIEPKGLPVIQCPVAVNFFIATNHQHVAHVEWHDARYWILRVAEHRKGDHAYWTALRNELDNGGISAFLHDMLSRDISGFVPGRDIPRNNAEHRKNRFASDPTHPALWMLDCVEENLWLGSEPLEGHYDDSGAAKIRGLGVPLFDAAGAGGARLRSGFIIDAYREWCRKQGKFAQPQGLNEFWKHLTSLGVSTLRSSAGRWRVMPSRADLIKSLGAMPGLK